MGEGGISILPDQDKHPGSEKDAKALGPRKKRKKKRGQRSGGAVSAPTQGRRGKFRGKRYP